MSGRPPVRKQPVSAKGAETPKGRADQELRQFVFIGGLHRSGTTLLCKTFGGHPQVSMFENTGVAADEGQHLQSVFPTGAAMGGAGRFGYNPDAALDEQSLLFSEANRCRLLDAWQPYWDMKLPVLVEKSPPNLLRTRFLDAMFPNSVFFIITRHPVAVILATRKWTRMKLVDQLEHWVYCHELFDQDRRHVRSTTVIRYEQLVATPQEVIAALQQHVGLLPHYPEVDVIQNLNEGYFLWWQRLLCHSRYRSYLNKLMCRFEPKINQFGYSFDQVADVRGH